MGVAEQHSLEIGRGFLVLSPFCQSEAFVEQSPTVGGLEFEHAIEAFDALWVLLHVLEGQAGTFPSVGIVGIKLQHLVEKRDRLLKIPIVQSLDSLLK